MADIEQETIASQANKTAENTPSVGDNPKKSFLSKIPHAKIVVPVGILCLLIVGGIVALTYINQQQKKQTQEKVYQALHAGNFKVAQNLAQEALKKNPNDKYLKITLIDAISGQGNQTGKEKEALAKVQPYIDSALATGANDRDTLISVGYAYEAAGEYEKALGYYEQAITLDPKFAYAYMRKGNILQFLQKPTEAQNNYLKAYGIDPEEPNTNLALAIDYMNNKNIEKASFHFQKIISNETNPFEIRGQAETGIASIKFGQGKFKDAAAEMKQVVTVSPNYSPAVGFYGYTLLFTGRGQEGFEYMKKAIQLNPRIAKNYTYSGIYLREVALDNEGALDYFMKADNLIPNDNTIQNNATKRQQLAFTEYNIAITYFKENKAEESIKWLSKAIENDPTMRATIASDMKRTKIFETLKGNPNFVALAL